MSRPRMSGRSLVRCLALLLVCGSGSPVSAEEDFARFCGVEHCIGVGNGTDAICLALRALGVGAGHEVLVPANSFIATSEAVTMAGARPAFVDCDPLTYNMDVEGLTRAITSRSKAVIPVHLYGRPAQMDEIKQIASDHGLFVVEDAAQAHGAEYHTRTATAPGPTPSR